MARLLIFLGAWLNILGDLLIKEWADGKTWLGWGVLAYVLDAFVWAKILRYGIPLSQALVLWEVLVVASGVLWGIAVKGEPISPVSGIGMAMCLAGILLIELGSHA